MVEIFTFVWDMFHNAILDLLEGYATIIKPGMEGKLIEAMRFFG